jgi:low affinity Fe/Cu permease
VKSRECEASVNSAPHQLADGRPPRPRISRVIDEITDALGDEKAFAVAAAVIVVVLVAGLVTQRLDWVASVAALVTFVMVFAIQHTSSRESRALNVKLDELIRVTNARNDLIGAEDESHGRLEQRSDELLKERVAGRRTSPGPHAH